jgi:hypothetical protein
VLIGLENGVPWSSVRSFSAGLVHLTSQYATSSETFDKEKTFGSDKVSTEA